jgi:hypothetical protein
MLYTFLSKKSLRKFYFNMLNRSHTTPTTTIEGIVNREDKHLENPRSSLRVRIVWFRDGRRLTNSRKIRIRQKRCVKFIINFTNKNKRV